jgi:leader peptidase (prepilin peptidase)/N-methyltransferase
VTLILVAVLGLVVGSFLNVVIVRLPRHESLLGRSICRHCGARVAAYDNVPLLSFALLSGRCRACRAAIGWRYPLVEASTAAAFVAAYLRFGSSPAFAMGSGLLAALIAVTAIDLEHQIIPDAITLPGVVVGVALAPLAGLTTWLDAVLGAAVCGGLLLAVIAVSGWAYARLDPSLPGGMGLGDMKLGAMLGAFVGWRSGLFALFVAVLAGGLVASLLLLAGRKGRKDAVPFGPFLALGGATALLVEPPDFLGL